jgi:hypothetical protein
VTTPESPVAEASRVPEGAQPIISKSKGWWRNALPAIGLFLLTLWVLRDYLTGRAAPPWDFWGGYLSNAYSWWDLGSFFSPPEYLPYLFSGYPAYLDIQSSSFYLPVGVIAETVGYTPWAAAALQAVTVAFGVLGLLFLSRRLGMAWGSSSVAAVGYLFAVGFFSNAQHTDIVRGWAFLPWLLLVLLPVRRISPLALIAASLLWFQFFVGSYPGILAAAAYLCAVWFLASLVMEEGSRRRYLVWVSVPLLSGGLMSSVKWVPFLLGAQAPEVSGLSANVVNLAGLSTILFPFNDEILPNDMTMRSFFVVPVLLLAVFFARAKSRVFVLGSLLVVLSLILGVGWLGVTTWQANLPLLDLSRFRVADFKAGLAVGLAILAAAGVQTLVYESVASRSWRWWLARSFAAWAVCFFVVAIGLTAGFTDANVRKGLLWLGGAAVALMIAFLIADSSQRSSHTGDWQRFVNRRGTAIAVLVVATFAIGSSWIAQSPTWSVPREEAEVGYLGQSVDSAIVSRLPIDLVTRPQRTGPPVPSSPPEVLSNTWNISVFSRQPSSGGYVNLKGQPRFAELLTYLTTNEQVDAMNVLAGESEVWRLAAGSSPSVDSVECIDEGACVESGLEVTQWSPGRIFVKVPDASSSRVVVNEVAYPGWVATICVDNECSTSDVGADADSFFMSAVVPDGPSTVEFSYQTPFRAWSWWLFAGGLLIVILGACLTFVRSRERRTATR